MTAMAERADHSATRWALLLIAFLESFAVILVERAVYFYTSGALGLSDRANLWIALGMGIAYTVGALCSHRAAAWVRERKLLAVVLAAQVGCHVVMFLGSSGVPLVAGILAVAWLNGLKWPVIESYVSAGRSPSGAAESIGRFNIAWSTAVPVSMIAAGPVISTHPSGLFVLAGLASVVSLLLLVRLPSAPAHLPPDHPERPPPDQVASCRALLASGRWSMLNSYALLFLLSPLLPGVFDRLGVPLILAPALVGLIDFMRLATFAAMRRWVGWHGKLWPLVASLPVLPVGFFLVLFGRELWMVLCGEVLFGIAAGASYYAALYYAMLVENAAVAAGGEHEGLIGLGFSLGPVAGLAGIALAGPVGSTVLGMIIGVSPLLLVATVGGIVPLRTLSRRRADSI